MMEETRRLAYLSAMGIDCYRRREPAAVTSEISPEETLPPVVESALLPEAGAAGAAGAAGPAISERASRVAELKSALSGPAKDNAASGRRREKSAEAGREVAANSQVQSDAEAGGAGKARVADKAEVAEVAEVAEKAEIAEVAEVAEAKRKGKTESNTTPGKLTEAEGQTPHQPDSSPDQDSKPQSDHEQLRFSLQFYPISGRLAVINEVPYRGSGSAEQQVKNLLRAILRAIDQDPDQLPDASRFNWPLSADDDAPMSHAPEACQALEGFLGKRLAENFYDVIVVFSGQCEELFNGNRIGQLLEESSNRVIHTHSLDAMLKIPALKRSVWESIRVIPKLL